MWSWQGQTETWWGDEAWGRVWITGRGADGRPCGAPPPCLSTMRGLQAKGLYAAVFGAGVVERGIGVPVHSVALTPVASPYWSVTSLIARSTAYCFLYDMTLIQVLYARLVY